VPSDGSELDRQEEISICHILNPALFGFSMGVIVWIRAGTVIALKKSTDPYDGFRAIHHDFFVGYLTLRSLLRSVYF
jgi:hypothetical protein